MPAILLVLPALFLLLLLFAIPLVRLLASSFEGTGLPYYVKAVGSDGLYLTILLRTFEIAGIVTAGCLLLGYPVALFLATTNRFWRTLGFACVMLPLWTSVLVRTYAWMVVLGRNGIINRILIDGGLMSEPLRLLNTRMAVISNNLANVNTTGFKKGRAAFQDLVYQNIRQVGAQSSQNTQYPTGLTLGTGVRIVATEKVYEQGSLQQTNNSLDVAITGRGFFQITLPDGTLAYTLDGSFKMDGQGNLVTSNGYALSPAITIPANAQTITIGADGTVSVTTTGTTAPTQVGQIQLADFINASGLQPRGDNLLIESVASGAPQVGTPGTNGLGATQQGSLETSNVNVVEELVSMIETQRAYEMNSKAISTTDQMLQYLTNNV